MAAVLLERDGRFFVYQTNLGIIGSDQTIEGAYRKFVAAKTALVEEAEHAGLRIDAPAVRASQVRIGPSSSGPRSASGELVIFLAKTLILILVIGAIGAAIAMTALGGRPLTVADVADKLAEIARDVSGMPAEKKESLRQSIGVLSRELGPVIDAWRNPPSQ